ncbi:MAG: class I SAM-dependent methyltransferase, partial [Anaerolineales bacterium]
DFTEKNNQAYGRFANAYDRLVKLFPFWRNWISTAVPHIVGPNVLEVSFGTGYLISQYASRFNTFGIDYNWEMASITQQNLKQSGTRAHIQQADIENLPYLDESFDTVVNTMAFTGYPNGLKALKEIRRVIKPNGRFVLVDIDYPRDRNRIGVQATRLWSALGDILRDMNGLFDQAGFQFSEEEIGGFGSVHLYIAIKA